MGAGMHIPVCVEMPFTAAVQLIPTLFVTTRAWRGTIVVHVRRAVLRVHSDRSSRSSLGAGGAHVLALAFGRT